MTTRKFVALAGFFFLFGLQTKAQQYFQQEVNYNIKVSLNDVKHELSASETMEYINNSPTELKEIYMHLWPNAYKNNNTALAKQLLEHSTVQQGNSTKFYYATPDQRGFIDSLDFKVNGQGVKWEYDSQNIDICKLTLNQPLKSGEKITISTPFHVKIPLGIFSRLGHLDQAYQITQWYPKPAVYDRFGWHAMPYLNQGEFYSEFGSFDVNITLPKNYVVGATGDMVDGDTELAWLNNKVKETEQIKEYTKDMAFPASDKELKTLRFKQSRVHDFAWFADKRFHVLKGEVELPHTKHKVTTWVMFTNSEPKLWMKSIPYMNDALYYYSLWNGDYPYNHATAIDGALTAGAGMEYPNITVIGPSSNAKELETVIVHEVGHNWFYGILGTNEREHPWMDEGVNSYNEYRYTGIKDAQRKDSAMKHLNDSLSKAGSHKRASAKTTMAVAGFSIPSSMGLNRINYRTLPDLEYQLVAARHSDQPTDIPAQEYSEINYGTIVYAKTGISFDYLRAYLGDVAMDKAMQNYFEKWKFKHPYPEDMKVALEESTGKNLDWFFNGLINSNQVLDYKLLSSDTNSITVKNNGDINGPIPITAFKKGKAVTTQWFDGFSGIKTLPFPKGKYDYYRIDTAQVVPEINRQNNMLSTHGLFKRIEPLKFQFLYSLPDPTKTTINYIPVVGWNNYNKTMVGGLFYNNFLPQKPVEYMVMPMYATGSKTLAGGADLGYNFTSNLFGVTEYNRLGLTGERYAYSTNSGLLNFNKLNPSLIHYNIQGSQYRDIGVRVTCLFTEVSTYDNNGVATGKELIKPYYTNFFLTFEDKRVVNPWRIRFDDVSNEDFGKIMANINYKINYAKSSKGIEISLFAGYSAIHNIFSNGQFSLSGFTGSEDYLHDGVFLGRSDNTGLRSQQFIETEGGFKTIYNRPFSPYTTRLNTDYMGTFGIKVPLPSLPVGIFATIGGYKDVEDLTIDKKKYLYEAGFYLNFSLLQVYFPIPAFLAKDVVSNGPNSNGGPYSNYIRFSLNLQNLRPFNLVKQIPY